jgi:hypothetical protein
MTTALTGRGLFIKRALKTTTENPVVYLIPASDLTLNKIPVKEVLRKRMNIPRTKEE